MTRSLVVFFFSLFIVSASWSATEILEPQELAQRMGLSPLVDPSDLSDVKVAILDNGFGSYKEGSSQLPASTKLVEGPINAPGETAHGLSMAQIIWTLTGSHSEGPKFYLINANGFSNFKAAVDYILREKIDIVLYSQVWSFGSNFDGTGFINAQVSRATEKGIVWINAAGNYGGRVYNGDLGQIKNRKGELIPFADGKDLKFENKLDENTVRVVLTWTDFEESENHNTEKDLDLLIYDSKGKLVASSELVQRGEAPPADKDSNLSSHAREIAVLQNLDRGQYKIRIRNQSGNFDTSDRFRVIVYSDKGESVKLESAQNRYEIMPPADHPDVITVGEAFETSSLGPTADGRIKPEILLPDSTIRFSNGVQVRGSSTAAALFTGWIAMVKSQKPHLKLSQIRKAIAKTSVAPALPAGFRALDRSQLRADIAALVPQDAALAIHPTGRVVVLVSQDPLTLPLFRNYQAFRYQPTDLIVYSPTYRVWSLFRPEQDFQIPTHYVEFRQWAQAQKSNGAFIWKNPIPWVDQL